MYKRPTYHLTASKGWINDPNGFSYYDNKYHLFAQHYPYDTKWGPMHWLHFTSHDLIQWEEIGIAIKPDHEYDKDFGCFSGTAIQIDNIHYLIYTGVADDKQRQCIAYSLDGIHYEKYDLNPIIYEKHLPEGYFINDFRDPKIFYKNNSFYVITGSKTKDKSSILMFKSQDLKTFNYVGIVYEMNDLNGGVLECPDIFFIDDTKCVLICSPMNKKNIENPYIFQNSSSTIYMIGNINLETAKFERLSEEIEFDLGFSFYAAQTLTYNNKYYLQAWQSMWGIDNNTGLDYNGQFIMTRELKLINNQLYQSYLPEISKYYTDNIEINTLVVNNYFKNDDINSDKCRLQLDLTIDGNSDIILLGDFKININTTTQLITITKTDKTNNMSYTRNLKFTEQLNNIKLDIIIDSFCIDILFNNGKYAFSSTYYYDNNNFKLTNNSGSLIINKLIKNNLY